jgi:periplasmic protein CpxP/Spy
MRRRARRFFIQFTVLSPSVEAENRNKRVANQFLVSNKILFLPHYLHIALLYIVHHAVKFMATEEKMMFRSRKSMAIIVAMFCIAAFMAFTSIAQAEGNPWGGKHCGKHHHHNYKKIAKKLGLTDSQKAQAKAIFQGNKDVMKTTFVSLRTERKNLHTLMQADTIDEAAIRAETAKIAGIQADLNVNRANMGAKFRAILTPAQLATLKSLHHKKHKGDSTKKAPA